MNAMAAIRARRARRARISRLAERARPAVRPVRRPGGLGVETTGVATARLDDALQRAALTWSPVVVRRWWTVLVTVLAVLGWLGGGPALALLGLAFGAGLPAAMLWTLRERADDRVARALGPALDSVARSVRSGAGLAHAVGEAAAGAPARLADDLRALSTAANRGRSFVAAIDEWAADRPVPGIRLAAAALALAAESGGPPARPLEGVATSLQERAALRKELRALSSQARLSAMVIVLAPLAFAVLAAGVDRGTAHFLLTTSAGQLCLALGLALDGAGALWMHKITRSAVP